MLIKFLFFVVGQLYIITSEYHQCLAIIKTKGIHISQSSKNSLLFIMLISVFSHFIYREYFIFHYS